jgi:uncharacterized protein YecE (DUF72 family)
MEFGKVNNPEGLDLRLPDEPEANRAILSGRPVAHPFLRLGLTGWGEKAWVGTLYPPGTPSSAFLAAYSRSFNSVELNSTFYAMPEVTVAERWKQGTPPDFRFMVKLPRQISHSLDLGLDHGQPDRFLAQLAPLGEKAPVCFLQLPPGNHTHLEVKLKALLARWPAAGPGLFLECRHPGLLKNEALMEFLAKHRVGLVITDTPGRRDLVHMRLLRPEVMIRFVTCGDHAIDRYRLDDWIRQLDHWFSHGLAQAWFYCHTHDNQRAQELARLFRDSARKAEAVWALSISEIKDYAFQQASLFETSG